MDRWDWRLLSDRTRRETRRLLSDPHAAEDAAQEALIRAWRARGACRTPETPAAWVGSIARREALREGGRAQLRAARQPSFEEPDPPPVADELDAKLLELDVSRALRPLPSADRLLIELRYRLDLAQPEVARLLGIPEGTVRVRLHRLRKRLREELREDS